MSQPKKQLDKPVTPSGSSENLSSIPLESEKEIDLLDQDLLQRMDIEDIKELKKFFSNKEKIKDIDLEYGIENLGEELTLNKMEFIEVFKNLSGNSVVSLPAAKLFENLDSDNKGYIKWDDVMNAILVKTEEPFKNVAKDWQPVDAEIDIRCAHHCKREFIIKIVPLYTKLTFCYAVVSELGRVGVYDGEFNLLDAYKIGLKPSTKNKEFLSEEQEDRQRRSKTTWVTDAVFVPDTYALFFSTSDRSLHLYDATGLIHVPLCLINGFPDTPTCMDYYSSNDPAKPSLLFIGDDEGNVTTMQFHQPKKTLFKKKDPDKLDKFLWHQLSEQSDYVTHYITKNVHDDSILQISYNSKSKTILTCSNDPNNTMVLRCIEKRRRSYVFKVPRGIMCFHLDKSLHIIVTGSKDGLVRIWNQVMTKQPIVSLHGHRAPIVDVRILKHMSAIISLSKKGVVKFWNINDYYCQMTVQLDFPVFKELGSKVNFGVRSIFPGPTIANVFDESSLTNLKETSTINSLAEEIENWLSTRDFEIQEDQEWCRKSIVVICCKYVALLKLNLPPSDALEDEYEPGLLKKYKMLPPPTREHYASMPSPWKVADAFTKTPPESEDTNGTDKSSSSSSTSKNLSIAKILKEIQGMNADPVKAPIKNMNTKKTQFKIKQEQMKMLVEHCAPHLALDLYDLAPIKFSCPLPMSRRMMEKGIDVSDPEQLIKGKLQKESTITTVDSLSDIQSSRSSKSSKFIGVKKTVAPSKGRQTPDWFTEKVKVVRPDSSESSENSEKNFN